MYNIILGGSRAPVLQDTSLHCQCRKINRSKNKNITISTYFKCLRIYF